MLGVPTLAVAACSDDDEATRDEAVVLRDMGGVGAAFLVLLAWELFERKAIITGLSPPNPTHLLCAGESIGVVEFESVSSSSSSSDNTSNRSRKNATVVSSEFNGLCNVDSCETKSNVCEYSV